MARKSSEQPIWLLVALLLAVVVGIAMFNMISKGTNIFNIFMGGNGGESQRIAMQQFCQAWVRPTETDVNGNINPRSSEPPQSSLSTQTDNFRTVGWLSTDKDPTTKAYVETGPPTGCDCIIFLASPTGGNLLSPTKARQFFEQEAADSSYAPGGCHQHAACTAQQSITELSGLFSDRTCSS